MTFWNIYDLYMKEPPTLIGLDDDVVRRRMGGSHMCAFWAGYDGIKQGNYPPPRGSLNGTAYRAGRDWKKLVTQGKAAALPGPDA